MADTGETASVTLHRSPSHLLHRALQHALDIYADSAGSGSPTQRQFAVLSAVADNEGLTQTDLVRATGIDRSTLAELVSRMIGKGHLVRERSSEDGRANTVRLTEKGRAALAEALPKVARADQKILSLIPARTRESFLSVLLTLSERAERDQAGSDEAVAAKPGKKKKKADKARAEKADKKKKKKAKKA
ncbi:MAG TPA: MarR family winged helix-turn-helix transcriptional regulator [Caulobacteraceae bacterium]|jgi:DNA-binding MarR family transcriptional regulator